MVFLGEHRRIHAFCRVVGRVAVEDRILPIIMPDECLKIFIFNDNAGQPCMGVEYKGKETADIKRL